MSADQAEKPRTHAGRFVKGHPGFKKKGSVNKMTKGNREAMIQAATELGGKAGLVGYYKANPKLLNEGLIEILPSRSKIDAAGNPVDNPAPGMSCPGIENFNIVGIPEDWSVIGLLGSQIHIPNAIVPRLRELLPKELFTPLPDPHLPAPIDDKPQDNVRPFLRLHDGASVEPEDDPESPAA